MDGHPGLDPDGKHGGGLILPFEGKIPVIGERAWVAPGAVVIGDVVLGARVNVWFTSVVRGDTNFIRIGDDTNIQDGTIIHVNRGNQPTIIGARVTVGHRAVVHACTIEDDCMIGIGAIVLDGAYVESGAVVAAGAVVSPGKRVGRGEMWAGCPARMLREVKEGESRFIANTPRNYYELSESYRKA